jgi:hypothetical protein
LFFFLSFRRRIPHPSTTSDRNVRTRDDCSCNAHLSRHVNTRTRFVSGRRWSRQMSSVRANNRYTTHVSITIPPHYH